MRAGKIGRLVGRAAIVGALTAGAWAAASMAAHADYNWNILPADGTTQAPPPAVPDSPQDGQ
jgi:hypothetical protein